MYLAAFLVLTHCAMQDAEVAEVRSYMTDHEPSFGDDCCEIFNHTATYVAVNAGKIFTLGFASRHKKLGKGRFHLDETATESDKDFLKKEIKNMFKANGDEISWEQVETILEKRGFSMKGTLKDGVMDATIWYKLEATFGHNSISDCSTACPTAPGGYTNAPITNESEEAPQPAPKPKPHAPQLAPQPAPKPETDMQRYMRLTAEAHKQQEEHMKNPNAPSPDMSELFGMVDGPDAVLSSDKLYEQNLQRQREYDKRLRGGAW